MRLQLLTVAAILGACPWLNGQDQPDISTVPPDLSVPAIHDGPPAAGKRCYQKTTGWEKTDVRYLLYLPTNWDASKKYPVIIELSGNGNYKNAFGDISTGWIEGSAMGYGISGGKDFIWVCMPYLDEAGKAPVNMWWGDPPLRKKETTVDHCVKTVREVCAKWGGDTDRVLLIGFSRGAIACNALGLANDEIASLWRGMIPFSHYHGVNEGWPFEGARRAAALDNLKRLKGRSQFICGESLAGLEKTKALLTEAKLIDQVTIRPTGFRNHSDTWLLRPSPAREEMRAWIAKVLK